MLPAYENSLENFCMYVLSNMLFWSPSTIPTFAELKSSKEDLANRVFLNKRKRLVLLYSYFRTYWDRLCIIMLPLDCYMGTDDLVFRRKFQFIWVVDFSLAYFAIFCSKIFLRRMKGDFLLEIIILLGLG